MLRRLMKLVLKPVAEPGIESLYRLCIAQARQPAFYAARHVPDTLDGRFDLLLLHVFLVMERLRGDNLHRQQLFDIMFADMDKSLRELGVSDVSIAKKIKPMLAAFYGRAQAYETALKASDESLSDTLRRNIYGNAASTPEDAKALTDYVRRAHALLAQHSVDALLRGELSFPEAI